MDSLFYKLIAVACLVESFHDFYGVQEELIKNNDTNGLGYNTLLGRMFYGLSSIVLSPYAWLALAFYIKSLN